MYFAAKLGPAILGFTSIFLITRSLSPENYGRYSLTLTLVLLMTQIMGAWLNQAQFFFLPKRRDRAAGMESWFDQVNFLIASLGTAVVVVSLYFCDLDGNVALAGGIVYFSQIYWNYLSTYYQSLEKPRIQLIATTYQVVVQIAIISLLYYFGYITVLSALIAVLCGFSAGIFFYVKRRNFSTPRNGSLSMTRVNFARYFRLAINYGGPFSLWFLFCQIYTLSDRFLLSWGGLQGDVGRYSASRDLLLGVASMFAMPLLMVAHPMIIRIWTETKGAREIEGIINRNLTIIFAVGVLFCTMLYAYGEDIFALLFSARYQLRDYEYAMIGGGIFFSVASMYSHKALEVTGGTLKMAVLGGAVAIFSLAGNLLAVSRFGLSAVILVGLLSQMAYFFGAAFLSRKLWRVFVAPKRVVAILLFAFIVYFLTHLIDLYVPGSISIRLPLPWGLLSGGILSIMALFALPEVSSMFVQHDP